MSELLNIGYIGRGLQIEEDPESHDFVDAANYSTLVSCMLRNDFQPTDEDLFMIASGRFKSKHYNAILGINNTDIKTFGYPSPQIGNVYPDDCTVFNNVAGPSYVWFLPENAFRLFWDDHLNISIDNSERTKLLEDADMSFDVFKRERIKKSVERLNEYYRKKRTDGRRDVRRVFVEKSEDIVQKRRMLKLCRTKIFNSILPNVRTIASEFNSNKVCDITSFDGIDFNKEVTMSDKGEIINFLIDPHYFSFGPLYPEINNTDTDNVFENVFDNCRLAYGEMASDLKYINKSPERMVVEFFDGKKAFMITEDVRDIILSRSFTARKVLFEKTKIGQLQNESLDMFSDKKERINSIVFV